MSEAPRSTGVDCLDPVTAMPGADVLLCPQAKEIIDLLSMLEEKTRGNLTPDEQVVMKDMLYALRMKFVSLTSGKSTIHTP